jgi:hypothetical protein
MRKDIQFPKVSEVYVAVVYEWNTVYKTNDWNAYIINNKDVDLETVLIVSKGIGSAKETPVMRHTIKMLPARSYAKIEYMQEAVLQLTNEFKISFFEGNTMFDKTYIFKKNSIHIKSLKKLPLMQEKGILVK